MSENPQVDPFDADEEHLSALGPRFILALAAKDKNDLDTAGEILRDILRIEPRLAEPQLELARILLDQGQLDDAEVYAREAVQILDAGGQWTDELPEAVLRSLAWDLLGEILRMKADDDEVVFGDEAVWKTLVGEARDCFVTAARLDPNNEHAVQAAFGFDPAALVDDDAELPTGPVLLEEPEA